MKAQSITFTDLTDAQMLALCDQVAAWRAMEKPAPPQDGPRKGNLGWAWHPIGAVEMGLMCHACDAHKNGLWAPTRESCEALGSRLIMASRRGPMPKDGEKIVVWLFTSRDIWREEWSPSWESHYWLGLVRIDSPENRAELEQTLREHGRGLGIEVGK